VPVLSGKVVSVPFYIAAGSTTKKSLVFAHIDFMKRAKLRSDMLQLAAKYVLSGTSPAARDDRYARRVAMALDAWANCVPDYYMTGKNTPTFISAAGFTRLTTDIQRASDHNGLAHEWEDDELLAFDAIYDSRALADLSVERGYDVRAHIANDLFGNIGDFIRDRVPVNVAIATNLSGPFTILAETARVLNRPDYILWMNDYLNETVQRKIMRDGVLGEGIGYSYNYVTENLDGARQTRDYFLSRPADTPALVDIKARSTEFVSLLVFGQGQWNALRLPDGTLPAFGDTTFSAVTARNSAATGVLPAYGHLAVGAGAGAQAVQINQNFSDDANHMRADVTGFTLWALGSELLGNVRYYNGTPGRQFDEQILSHNAVTIDRVNMSRGSWNVGNNNHKFTSGNLTLFEPGQDGLAVTEVDGQRPYANKASRYQRVMLLDTTDPDRPYVVDVFRVTGGATHDYTFHGAIRFDQTAESSIPLIPDPAPFPMLESGETWVEPTSSGSSFPYYGFWRDVSNGPSPGSFNITYRDASAAHRDVRLWMTDDPGDSVNLGRTPNPERTNTTPPNWYKYWRPSLILRHRVASGPLESLFASVIEPLQGGVSAIQSVERVPLSDPGLEAVALRITFVDGHVDAVIVNLHNPRVAGASGGSATVATADGQFVLTGRVGLHSARADGERAWSVAATSFRFGSADLTTPNAVYQGAIDTAGDAFVTATDLPAGDAVAGRQLSLAFDSYRVVPASNGAVQRGISEMFQIDHVERQDGQSVVFLSDDPQLEQNADGSVTKQMAPQRTFQGPLTFEVATGLDIAPIEAVAPLRIPSNRPHDVPLAISDLGGVHADVLSVSAVSSNPTVIPAEGLVPSGSGANRVLTLRPDVHANGDTTITVVATDGTNATSRSFVVSVEFANDPPTISALPDRGIDEDTTTGPIAFAVGDLESAPEALTVTATASDATLLPPGSIVLGGSGAARVLSLTPAPNQNGSATITLTVSDGLASTTTRFTLTVRPVDDPPSLAPLADLTIGEISSTGPIAIHLGDIDSPAESLVVTAASSDPTLVPPGTIVLGGTGLERSVTVTPSAHGVGKAVITLTVSDGLLAVSQSFTLTVVAAPRITPLGDRVILEDTTTGALRFQVSDADTAADALSVAATSSNPAIVPDANLVLAGSGEQRTITVTPGPNQNGVVTVTVRASDGVSTASASLRVFVIPVNDPPTISPLPSQVIAMGGSTGALPFTIGDVETPPDALLLVAISTNPVLVPPRGIVLQGSGTSRTVTVTPAPGHGGRTTITLILSDGEAITRTSFAVRVMGSEDADIDPLPGP
jgi:hypothetical protein